jgi:hypothetical protein
MAAKRLKKSHIQRIIKEAEEGLEHGDKTILRVITALLHCKFNHALENKKRYSKLAKEESNVFYSGVEKEFVLGTLNPKSQPPITEKQNKAVREYLSFFKTSSDKLTAKSQLKDHHPSLGLT